MSENLRTYLRGVYAFDAVARRVPDNAWDNPTPCAEWSARQVLGHVSWGVRAIAAGASDGSPPEPKPEAEIAGDNPLEAWEQARTEITDALDRKGALQREIDSPFGRMSVDGALGVFLGDVIMHAWDLARAAGVDHGIPDDLADRVATGLGRAGDVIRQPGLFGPAVEVPAGADAATRMAAVAGRLV